MAGGGPGAGRGGSGRPAAASVIVHAGVTVVVAAVVVDDEEVRSGYASDVKRPRASEGRLEARVRFRGSRIELGVGDGVAVNLTEGDGRGPDGRERCCARRERVWSSRGQIMQWVSYAK